MTLNIDYVLPYVMYITYYVTNNGHIDFRPAPIFSSIP